MVDYEVLWTALVLVSTAAGFFAGQLYARV